MVNIPENLIVILVGIILGISVVLMMRARQVRRNRHAFGYSYGRAQQARRWLTVGAVLGLGLVLSFAGYRLWVNLRPPVLPETAGAASEDVYLQLSDPLSNMFITIPTLGVRTDLVPAPFVANQWDISRLTDEVAHLEGTPLPGQPGNVVLAGHVTVPGAGWGPFQELEQLQVGDRIFIETSQNTLVYDVIEIKTVEATDVEVTFPTPEDRLTLITCTGWSDILQAYVQRVVVVAVPAG